MKKWINIAVIAIITLIGWRLFGGSLWVWLIVTTLFRGVIRLLFSVALGIVIYVLIYIAIFGSMFWILIN